MEEETGIIEWRRNWVALNVGGNGLPRMEDETGILEWRRNWVAMNGGGNGLP